MVSLILVTPSEYCFADLNSNHSVIMAYLHLLNRKHSNMRVAVGKPANIVDMSMMGKKLISEMDKTAAELPDDLGEEALNDQTDLKNEEFIYIL